MVAIEPSAAMREVLEEEAREQGVANLLVVPATWEEANVEPAEFVYASNVTYGVMHIKPFIRKMDEKATRAVALVTFAEPRQSRIAPFWRFVYGEERLRLPCRAELIDVLLELGVEPRLIDLPAHQPQPFGTRVEARAELRRRLYVGSGTSWDARLDEAIDDLTEERGGLLWSKQERPNERSIIWCEPDQMP